MLVVLTYVVGNYNERYWKKRGVKFYNKNKVFGVFWDFFTRDGALFERFGDLHKKYRNEPAIGIGAGLTPALFVIDYKNIQHILLEDFHSFNHRGVQGAVGDNLAESIIFLYGPKWKIMREAMSPLFTPSKLKNMFYIKDKCAQDFVAYLKENPSTWKGNCFETLMTFCNASVCAAIFGVGSESIFDSPFLEVVKKITAPTLKNNVKLTMMSLTPSLADLVGLKLFKEYQEFLVESIKKVIEERRKDTLKLSKHDFADLCISIQHNGVLKDPITGFEIEPTYELLTAQAMFFLVAGVEPVATLIFTTFLDLGRNPEILKKLHQEIDETFDKHGNNLTYDIVSEMKYVDKVLSETMRKNSPIGFITRQCIKDTVLPVGNIKVEKGTRIFTPIYQMHHDPNLYPDPHVFDPERFANSSKLGDENFMPFGIGNRMCLGARYSKMQMAAGVVHFLRHFTVKTIEYGGPTKYRYHLTSVRPINADVEFVPRSVA